MVLNVLTHIEAPEHHRQARDFHLSEYLTDIASLHHEAVQFDHALYHAAVEEVCRLRVASVKFLRRQLQLDYPQALHFIRCMEADGIIRRTEHRSRESRRGWRYEVMME
ncbi:MAG: hypothetical protein CL610_22690 [Anaerolineaceae bacterium]|nr:hypothetical protein [Anaerolineaceae bacterium]